MATTKAFAKMPDTYFRLVKQFPLTHIHDDAHLDHAQKVIDGLLTEELDEGGQAYLDALTDLVEVYEDEHHRIPDASEADVLRYLMEDRGLTLIAMAKQARMTSPTLSSILAGTRSLTKAQVISLAKFFHVSPAVFLPAI